MAVSTHDFNQQTRFLGLNVPKVFPVNVPDLTQFPGFRVWTRVEIEDAVRTKPIKRRDQFRGPDWIVDQGRVGSCALAASSAALRRAMELNGRNDNPKLSWEYGYAEAVDGDDNGTELITAMKVLQAGLPPLDLHRHPLNRDIRKSDYGADESAAAQQHKAEACYAIDTDMQLATFVLSGQGAAVVAVDVGGDFSDLDVNQQPPDGGGPGNHAVGVDDVDIINGQLMFDCFNNWSESWGVGGRCRLGWDGNLKRTVRFHRFFAILAASNPNVPVV
jgi:hypothetical protein